MFTFDAIEKSLYGGVSPDRVPDAIKNRFSMVFGSKALDNRLQVKISERQIRFFFYDHDFGENEWDPNGIQNHDYLKEIGFITLTRRKDAGNDILDFPQNIGNLDLYYEKDKTDGCSLKIWGSITDCVNRWAPEFFGFPFLKGWKELDWAKIEEQNNEVVKRKKEDVFRCFVRCCLLNFIYEFENRGQCFGGSPIYDIVRDKLRESDVYKMLSAKIDYTQYLYKDTYLSRNQEKYTYYAQKFADCLMDKRLNKVISPDNYVIPGTKKERKWINDIWNKIVAKLSVVRQDGQGWFYNPEEELDGILAKNREYELERGKWVKQANKDFKESCNNLTKEERKREKDKIKKGGSVSVLRVTLVSKIRSFLYTKHAVFKAMTSSKSKRLFCAAQILMVVFNAILIIGFLHYDTWDLLFDYLLSFVFVVAIVVLALLGRAGWINGHSVESVFNALFPRILVAEAAAWLTIGVAEDLVKSMLWIERTSIRMAIIAVFFLVGVLLFGEAKQHSPYTKRGENITKSLLVMNHSIFFALVFGCVMQVVFYENLLKTSNVLPDVAYKEHFGNVENYFQHVEDVEQSINDYQSFIQAYDLTISGMSGDNSGQVTLKGKGFGSHDTIDIVLYNKLVFQSSFIKTLNDSDNIVTYQNKLVDAVNESKGALIGLWKEAKMEYDSVFCIEMRKYLGDATDSDVTRFNNNWISHVLPILNNEIRIAKNHRLNDDYETLSKWAKVDGDDDSGKGTGSIYIDSLLQESKLIKYRRDIYWKPDQHGEESIQLDSQHVSKSFYPTLQLMHTLIVLVLAFITQLIISDKSVTEPL